MSSKIGKRRLFTGKIRHALMLDTQKSVLYNNIIGMKMPQSGKPYRLQSHIPEVIYINGRKNALPAEQSRR